VIFEKNPKANKITSQARREKKSFAKIIFFEAELSDKH
jgi:hypothetical protein